MEWKRDAQNKREKMKRKKAYEYGRWCTPLGGWETPW